MALQTGIIEVEIKATPDKKSFNDGINFARDTGKKIDKAMRSKLTLDTIKAEDKIKGIKKILKTDIPTEKKVKLRIDLADTKRQLTESRRQLNNLANTGDAATSRLQRKFDGLGKGVRGFFKSFIGPAAIAGVVAGFKNIVNGFDEANSSIIKATGASGKALEGLKADFNATLGDVPQSAAEVATAIGEINTRFGETGVGLQSLSKNFLDFARVTGTDVAGSIRLISRLQKDFGLENQDVPLLLDKITRAGQATGISVEKLTGITTQFGVQFRALGFGLDESLALISKFEAEGVNTEAILAGLNKGVNELAKETGTSIPDAFQAFTDSIKNAATESEALAIASDILGSRAGPQMALAVREGRLEFEDFIGVLQNAEGTLDTTAEAALTTAESIKQSFNNLLSAIQPILESLGGLVAGFFQATADFFSLFSSSGGEVVTRLSQINDAVAENSIQIQQLNIDYRDGKISIDEYNKSLAGLNETKSELNTIAGEEASIVAALTEEYNKAQTQIDSNNTSIEELTFQIASNNFMVDRGTKSSEEAREANVKLQARIEELTGANEGLLAIQGAVEGGTNSLQVALDTLTTAATQDEFKRLQTEALKTLDALIAVQRGILQADGGSFGMVGVAQIQAQETLNSLVIEQIKLQNSVFSPTTTTPSGVPKGPGGGGGGGKSAATKNAEKEAADLLKIKEDQAKEAADIAKEEATITEEAFKDAFDAIGDRIKDKEKDVKDFTKEIEKSIDKIADIDAKIGELGVSASEDLASRFVEVEEEIADPETDSARLEALQAERDLILANTTEEERAEAIRKEGLSDTEKILEKRDLEIAALEEKKVTEQLALDTATAGREAALLQIEDIRATEQKLSEEAIAQTGKEFLEKAKSAQGYADLLDSLFGDTVNGGAGPAGGVPVTGGGATGGTTIIEEGDIQVELNVEGVIDQSLIDSILDQAALKIQDARVTRANQ